MKKRYVTVLLFFLLLALTIPIGQPAYAASNTSPFDESFFGNEYRSDGATGINIFNAFRLNLRAVKYTRLFNYDIGLYSDCCEWEPHRERLINLLRVVEETPAGNRPSSPSDTDYGELLSDPEQLDITFTDGSRISYTFYEHAIKVAGESLEGEPLFAAGIKKVEPEIYSYFLKFIKTSYWRPAWLGSMNEGRIKSIDIMERSSKRSCSILPENEQFHPLIESLQMAGCKSGSFQQPQKSEFTGDYTVKINFKSGVVFTLQIMPDRLEIASSNMPNLCSYELGDFYSNLLIKRLNNLLQ